MKKIFSICLFLVTLPVFAQPVKDRSSTGPVPPKGVDIIGHIFDSKGVTLEVVIDGVPAYIWRHGCGPTAEGMVFGYYDTHGFPNLLPGNGAIQTSAIDQAIASDEHYNDYSLPLDEAPTIKPDKSELPVGDEHPNNSIADYMGTSQSIKGNYWMWTLPSDIIPAWENYISEKVPDYVGTGRKYAFDDFPFDSLLANINRNQPLVFLVDVSGDGVYDHYVCVVGCGTEDEIDHYCCLNTWDSSLHWYPFTKMKNGVEWGVLNCFTFDIHKLYKWTGATSTDWGTAGNWNYNAVPASTDIVLIPDVTNDPVINEDPATPAICRDLKINSGASLTIAAGKALKVNRTLTNNAGISGLIIKSDGNGNNGQLITNAASVNGTVELDLKGGMGDPGYSFHYITPPVETMYIGTTIQDVKNNLGLTHFNGDLMRYNEFSAVGSKMDGWQYFDNYPDPLPGFSSLTPDKGYNIYLTADDKITFNGELNAEQHTFNLSYTPGNAGIGWNLVGNPYPCNYDLTGISGLIEEDDGISNTVYYNKNGEYKYYNVKTGIGSEGYDNIIPPMQGFFVYVTATGKSLALPVGSKTFLSSQERSKGSSNDTKGSYIQKVKLVLSHGPNSDETFICLADNATDSFNENYDAFKLFGSNSVKPFIYSKLDGVDYFMKAVAPPATESVSVPLVVVVKESGSHTINITEFENLQGLSVKLKHGAVEVLLGPGSYYTFESDPGTYNDFTLVFENITTGENPPEQQTLKTWYSNNYLYINSTTGIRSGNSRLILYDFTGRQVINNNNLHIVPGETIRIPVNPKKGFYVTDIEIDNIHYKSKIIVY
jgi:hypothetical protein